MRGVFLKNGLVHRLSQICKSDTKNAILIPRDRINRGTHHHYHNLNKSRESASEAFSIPFSSSSSSSSSSSRSGIGFIGWYLGVVQSRPLLTKSITSSLIYAAADCSAQTISCQSSETYDFVRTLRMAGYGMLILGPSLHFWFNFMSKVLPKRDLLTTLKKIFLGQTTFGPSMTVIFFSANAAAQGENGSDILARLKRDLIPTLINGAMYWPICDFVTFKFIPVHLQPLVSNSFSYLWTIYLTYMASLERADTQ